MIAIIDYGSGNVAAIANIYRQLGVACSVVSDYSKLLSASKYILPGVGHFDYTMKSIRSSGLSETLNEQILVKKKPVLGICVGMQLLADSSEEGDETGLCWIPGHVSRIDAEARGVRLPHMGWNSVSIHADPMGLFADIDQTAGFYFLHSYHFLPSSTASIMATTDYSVPLVCSVSNSENIFGVQFHPEKSHQNGISLFNNFAKI